MIVGACVVVVVFVVTVVCGVIVVCGVVVVCVAIVVCGVVDEKHGGRDRWWSSERAFSRRGHGVGAN